MAAPDEPEKIGEADELFPRKFGITALLQKFRDPKRGKADEFLIIDTGTEPAIVFALTTNQQVVAIRQFRYAAGRVILELPGGNVRGRESPEEVAGRELEEETGYRAGNIRRLTERPIWFEPAILASPFWPCLATGCTPVSAPTHDAGEYITIALHPLEEWVAKVRAGGVEDAKSIVTTLLALPHLGTSLSK